MRTTKEERADLRARCRAGVIAITTDAALVAALIDDVEEAEALAKAGAHRWAIAAAEVSKLRAELAKARAERDARPEITAADAAAFLEHRDYHGTFIDAAGRRKEAPHRALDALRAHARKVVSHG